jgi:hypothetical protein
LPASEEASAVPFAGRHASLRRSRTSPGAGCATRKALHHEARTPARKRLHRQRKRRNLASKCFRFAVGAPQLAGAGGDEDSRPSG